jgi:hypothetical protein
LRCAFSWYAGASPQCLAGSDGEGKVVEGDAEPVSTRGLGGDVVVAAAQVLDEGMSCGEDPGGAGGRFRPRIAPSRAFSRPWSVSIGLFACRSTVCKAEGTSSSRTRG